MRNPTKTRTIERNWHRELKRRYSRFLIRILTRLREMDSGIVVNAFELDPWRQRLFMSFVQQMIDSELLGEWHRRYQSHAYERGVSMTFGSLRAQGVRATPDIGEFLQTVGDTPSFPVFGAKHMQVMDFLFSRNAEEQQGITVSMAKEIRQIIFDGADRGVSINQVARDITKRVDVALSKARTIATTETIQAHQRATTAEAKRISQEIGEEIGLRWITSRDEKVRDRHMRWHGTIASPDENLKRIQVSPWNCRCAQIPVPKFADTPKAQEKFDKQRAALLLMAA